MKKTLSIILVLVMCLSLSACGDIKSAPDNYIGVWESSRMRFIINEGGVGRYEQPYSDTRYFDFTWEVKDEILTIYITGVASDYLASFELSEDGTALNLLHNGLPSYYADETTFFKKQ